MRRHQQRTARRAIVPAAIIASLGIAGGAALGEPVSFELVSHDVQVDRGAQTATFTLTFTRAPNFSTSAFQYEIDAAWPGLDSAGGAGTIDFNSISTVVRGSEIGAGSAVPIRDRDGNGGAGAGGWGAVRALVPFQVQDQNLTFTTALSNIGDTDGVFRYRLFTTDSGQVTSDATGVAIPLPPAVAAGLVTLGGLGFALVLRRQRRRTSATI